MRPRAIAAFALGPIGAAILGFITLPLITWFFDQKDIGRIAMLQVAISLSTLLFSFGLDQAYVREFHETKDKAGLLKASVMPGLLTLCLLLVLLVSFGNSISVYLFEVDSLIFSALVALAVLASFISRFLSLILRMNEQGLAYSASQILPKLIFIVIVLWYVLGGAEKTLAHLLWATVASTVAVCVIYSWNTRKEWLEAVRSKLCYQQLISLFRFGLPLILGGLSFWGLTATDKILLKELSNFEQLGIYSVAVSLAAAATIIQSVFSTVWAPTVYKWASAGDCVEKIHQVNRYVLFAVVVLFCLAGLFSWVITYILPDSYSAVQWIVIPCLGYPLLYTLSETTAVGIGITRRSGFAMLASVLAFMINAILGWLLIPLYGAAGAAVSTCMAFGVFFVLRTEFSIYLWKPIPRLLMYSYCFMVLSLSVANCLLGEEYTHVMLGLWLTILCSVKIYFNNEIGKFSNYIEATFWRRIV